MRRDGDGARPVHPQLPVAGRQRQPQGRVRAGTRLRRLRIYYPSPGCRQGTILAPVAAWRRLPGSGGTWPLDILVCSAARWPPRTTSSRANGRTIRVHEQAAETTPPEHGPAPPGQAPGPGAGPCGPDVAQAGRAAGTQAGLGVHWQVAARHCQWQVGLSVTGPVTKLHWPCRISYQERECVVVDCGES